MPIPCHFQHLWLYQSAVYSVIMIFATLLIISSLLSQTTSASSPPPIANLTYAAFSGLTLPNSVNQFLGLPYAQPPIGPFRWRSPSPPLPSSSGSGPIPATEFKPICLGTGVAYPTPGQSEDCLYANIWAPANATSESRLPVWVFIQGGGYNALSNYNWNGSEVAQRSGQSDVGGEKLMNMQKYKE
ncbi:uncharacterized protein PODANS_1_16880 [Podospora anserina S mat+]|uniref:Podospora anserina S mat+ genomic DNA chromosome 1, supercontig 4 n=1 Tax=Podospora anserina (strain S / ATCC MYA-4624 / DSM 980 / FGSC 10383) TaxID=515849 RepID=B2ATT3_PODAN|nr:uncharacterized protein PODANS_1_16880 [Podospora anserina S mat+]CAP67806.1 unnamed protein product [Podospora anserina S mat+]